MLVLDLSASVYEDAFGQTIRKLARSGERHRRRRVLGRCATSCCRRARRPASCCRCSGFSGPMRPAPPASSRMIHGRTSAPARGSPQGLRVAHETLQREGANNGSIVLVSDLEILPDEVVRLSDVAAELRQDGIGLRIVPLFPTPAKYARIRQIVGDSAFLRESSAASPVAAPEGRSVRHALPWGLRPRRARARVPARSQRAAAQPAGGAPVTRRKTWAVRIAAVLAVPAALALIVLARRRPARAEATLPPTTSASRAARACDACSGTTSASSPGIPASVFSAREDDVAHRKTLALFAQVQPGQGGGHLARAGGAARARSSR